MTITRIEKRETRIRAYDGATIVWSLCHMEGWGWFNPVWIITKVNTETTNGNR